MPDLPHVLVPHPLGGVKEDAVRAKTVPVVDDLIDALTSAG